MSRSHLRKHLEYKQEKTLTLSFVCDKPPVRVFLLLFTVFLFYSAVLKHNMNSRTLLKLILNDLSHYKYTTLFRNKKPPPKEWSNQNI